MNKFINTILTITLAVSGLTSCSDWLDVQPESQQREKDMFKNYDGFKDALTGCYSSMASRSLYGERLTISDIEYLACLWNEPTNNTTPRWKYLYQHNYKNQNAENAIRNIYGGLFNVIAQANKVIEHGQQADVIGDDQIRKVILGEAYALRAYCHFDVLRLFGQMPQNPTRQVMLPYALGTGIEYEAPYLSFNEYVAQLEKDLNEAEKLLNGSDPIQTYNYDVLNNMIKEATVPEDDFMQFRQFRLNYFAVRALKARMYLYIGQLEKAYQEARYVIDAKVAGKPFMELSGVEDIKKHYYSLPNECIFALSNNKIADYLPEMMHGYNGQVTGDRNLVITLDMLNKILYDGANTTSDNRYLKVWNKASSDVTGTKFPTLLKYSYNPGDYERSDQLSKLMTKLQFMPLIRMSEMYLIAMESTNDLAEANSLYKTYMASHNVNVTEGFKSLEDVKEEVMKDYHREFYAEGVMFYAYKRTGTKQLMFMRKAMSEDNYILPLPTSESNPNEKPTK
ncbi:RagB/SusD family nutrient uptake outer membrane protein [Hoylesella timonensis 4401737 = DSM 22865 = JCM 15640]|uniref:RagB/SusD family nutrient uptake outer membrane protein n=1 Tax=Hoylesella timonensis TaxID=386414 RepID=UPI0003FB6C67|nr:RagB/SusD family nutrient uptake outer membrane protein [Hoylesella timonensis]